MKDDKETDQRILDAAEALFARHGFAATSLRSITAAAGVNLAAVHYHFGSKDSLIEAVFSRRLRPVNRERLRLLDEAEKAGQPGPPSVETILEAFLGPVLRMSGDPLQGGAVVMRLLGNALSQPDERIRRMFLQQFAEIVRRFTTALKKALPDHPPPEVFWRFLFTIGAMAHTLAWSHDMASLSHGQCAAEDSTTTLRRLVGFIAAGMRAPLTVTPDRRETA
ncbi:MAG: TetR/AcrR family transcriptional regulator [Acidobacteriota bacterium]